MAGDAGGRLAGDNCGEHCPFLNRTDRRCSDYLSLDRLCHAFDYCFGEYKSCPVYLELLLERRVRRLSGAFVLPGVAENDVIHGRPLVQLTVSRPISRNNAPARGEPQTHRYEQPLAAA